MENAPSLQPSHSGTPRPRPSFGNLFRATRALGGRTLDITRPVTPDQLRRLARAVLAAFALLALVVGVLVALRGTSAESTVVARQLPLPEPLALPADAITVAAPTLEQAAPSTGVTGTTALPALPVPPALADRIVAGEAGIVPARPFAFGRASAIDKGRALQCLAAAIYYEAASEPDAGQQAVAQVVLNRVRHPAFPATVCGVVYQGSERAGCQFSFACDGAMSRPPSRSGWSRATQVAAMALSGRVYTPVGLATHYHTYAVTPAWNRSLVMTDVVGAHFFHRWKGYWGTAAAFAQRYRGGEPVPGPHLSVAPPPSPTTPVVVDPVVLAAAASPVAAVAAKPVTPLADVQPRYRESGTAIRPAIAAVRGDDADDQVLPRWRDSGKPLRP